MADSRVPLKIYVVGRPQFDLPSFLAFLHDRRTTWRRTPAVSAIEELVEAAGRVCYMSFGDRQSPRTTADYVKNLIAMGHDSVLEHVSWSLIATGISRALSHQLVRHRAGFAFSQLSQQYHDESDAEFLMPPALESNPEALAAWQRAVTVAQESYRQILSLLSDEDSIVRKSKKEQLRARRSAARSVLPNSTATIVFMSANARAIRHFLTVRGNIVGDEEMRCFAAALLSALQPEAPSLFSEFSLTRLPDGSPIVAKTT